MTPPLPLADGARLLGIHPKTLGHWLKQAQISLIPHPADARVKCVMEPDLQRVASLHSRPYSACAQLDATAPPLFPLHAPAGKEQEPLETDAVQPSSLQGEPDLRDQISRLETKVMTLQEQLAQLALALLQERERVVEQRISVLESLVHQLLGRPLHDLQPPEAKQEPATNSGKDRQLLACEQLARSRMPPLIEYSKQGTYVIVNSQEGELHLEPNSVQWFDWLATISSFRFVGLSGRFTACRESKGGRGWIAHRSVHQRYYKRYIGVTDRLTIASLEQAAATLLTPATSM